MTKLSEKAKEEQRKRIIGFEITTNILIFKIKEDKVKWGCYGKKGAFWSTLHGKEKDNDKMFYALNHLVFFSNCIIKN